MNRRLQRYFAHYPERGSGTIASMARRGEADRLRVVRSWLPDCRGISILDVGCGDGEFLSKLLNEHERPSLIRLEDIVEKWVNLAHYKLRDAALEVASHVVDGTSCKDPGRYDLVLAFGISDYTADWRGLVDQLRGRTKGLLLTDFPRAGTWYNRGRAAWLRCHGLSLKTINRAGLYELIGETNAVVEELPLQWVVRFEVGTAHSQM